MKIIIITGPPYSGKGTQCEILEKTLNYKHISTGDRIRKEKENQSRLGAIMKDYEEKGMLVPDEIMEELLQTILQENRDEKGIIFDGYPRTIPQVDTIINLLERNNEVIDKVINIEVPIPELLIRAKKRAASSTRKDDKDEAIHIKRIEVFEKNTLPAIHYFKSKTKVLDIDGMGSIEEITEKIKNSI